MFLLLVSGSSVYTRRETIPGSSTYLLSVFDIFSKYLSRDSATHTRQISRLAKDSEELSYICIKIFNVVLKKRCFIIRLRNIVNTETTFVSEENVVAQTIPL